MYAGAAWTFVWRHGIATLSLCHLFYSQRRNISVVTKKCHDRSQETKPTTLWQDVPELHFFVILLYFNLG
jgi:hypothetical protein